MRRQKTLDQRSDEIAVGLRRFGLKRGMRTVLMVKPSLEFFALTFALFKVGAVPVLIDPGMGVKNLGPCLDEAAPEVFLGIPRAQLARRLLGWGKATIRLAVTIAPGVPGLRVEDRDAGAFPIAPRILVGSTWPGRVASISGPIAVIPSAGPNRAKSGKVQRSISPGSMP